MGTIIKKYRSAFNTSKKRLRLNLGVLLFCGLLYVCNECFLKHAVSWLWVHCYLNDCIAGGMFLACCNLICLPDYPDGIDFLHELYLIEFAGIFWEFVAPLYLGNSVSDYYDIVAYNVGALIYQVCIQICVLRNQ